MSDDSGVASGNEAESNDLMNDEDDRERNINIEVVHNVANVAEAANIPDDVQLDPSNDSPINENGPVQESDMNVDSVSTNNEASTSGSSSGHLYEPIIPPPSPSDSIPSTSMDLSEASSSSMFLKFPCSKIDFSERLAFLQAAACQHDFQGKIRLPRKRFYNPRLYSSDLIDEKQLRLAANSNDITSLLRLLEKGVNPNASDERDRTAIHFAASHGYTEIVAALINYGADPNLKDTIGNTPLNLAFTAKKIPTVHVLLENGASLHTLDKMPYTPLALAKLKLSLLPDILSPLRLKTEIDSIFQSIMDNYKHSILNALQERIKARETKQEIKQDVDELLQYLENLSL